MGLDGWLYVDDLLACNNWSNMNIIEWWLQQCLLKLQVWADENGFKFSESKTMCVHFVRGVMLTSTLSYFQMENLFRDVSEAKYFGDDI